MPSFSGAMSSNNIGNAKRSMGGNSAQFGGIRAGSGVEVTAEEIRTSLMGLHQERLSHLRALGSTAQDDQGDKFELPAF